MREASIASAVCLRSNGSVCVRSGRASNWSARRLADKTWRNRLLPVKSPDFQSHYEKVMNRHTVELLFLAALWGGSFLFMRVAAPELGPVVMIVLRVGIASLMLSP